MQRKLAKYEETSVKIMNKRNRAISLSVDWENMVREEDSLGGGKISSAAIAYERPQIDFCTGSNYTGKWNQLGMAVAGNFVFPYGCEYEGGIEDGMFHGEGTLSYPMGQKLEGVWYKGKMVSYKFSHVDGLEFTDPWKYCKMPDRRFHVSLREGLQPAGREFLTNQQPTRRIYKGCYDTGDGFYNPKTRSIKKVRDPDDYNNLDTKFKVDDEEEEEEEDADQDDPVWFKNVSIVTNDEHDWIVTHCRKAWDEPAGYRPDLYEDWVSGRHKQLETLDAKYETKDELDLTEYKESQTDPSILGTEAETVSEKTFEYHGTGRMLTPSLAKAYSLK